MDFEHIESSGEGAAGGGDEGSDQICDLAFGERARRGVTFALRHVAWPHALPRRLGPVMTLDRRGAVPWAFRAGAPAGMADLDAAGGAVLVIEIGDAPEGRDLRVLPDPGAAVGDASIAGHPRRFDEAER